LCAKDSVRHDRRPDSRAWIGVLLFPSPGEGLGRARQCPRTTYRPKYVSYSRRAWLEESRGLLSISTTISARTRCSDGIAGGFRSQRSCERMCSCNRLFERVLSSVRRCRSRTCSRRDSKSASSSAHASQSAGVCFLPDAVSEERAQLASSSLVKMLSAGDASRRSFAEPGALSSTTPTHRPLPRRASQGASSYRRPVLGALSNVRQDSRAFKSAARHPRARLSALELPDPMLSRPGPLPSC
jgi:hypothetical protein